MVRTTSRTAPLGLIAAFLTAALIGCAVGERAETLLSILKTSSANFGARWSDMR